VYGQTIAFLDLTFATLLVASVMTVRFGRIRRLRGMTRRLVSLRQSYQRFCASPTDLLAILNLARQLDVLREYGEGRLGARRSLALRIRGRTGRLVVLDNIFLRNPLIQTEVTRELEEMAEICRQESKRLSAGYRSPYNLYNLPSSALDYLGLPLSIRQAITVDSAGAVLCALIAIAVASWNG
jgi:hypothetical protein